MKEEPKKKILIGVPTRGRIHALVVDRLISALNDKRYSVDLYIEINSRSVEEARNRIVKQALLKEADYLYMLDDDVVPTKNPLDLIELEESIIACPYPLSYLNNQLEREDRWSTKPWFQGDIHVVEKSGAGCLLISREVLEKIKAPFTAPRDRDGLWALSEDYSFCDRARNHGFQVRAHFGYPCWHIAETYLQEPYGKPKKVTVESKKEDEYEIMSKET